jgi:hypothetical protein
MQTDQGMADLPLAETIRRYHTPSVRGSVKAGAGRAALPTDQIKVYIT